MLALVSEDQIWWKLVVYVGFYVEGKFFVHIWVIVCILVYMWSYKAFFMAVFFKIKIAWHFSRSRFWAFFKIKILGIFQDQDFWHF